MPTGSLDVRVFSRPARSVACNRRFVWAPDLGLSEDREVIPKEGNESAPWHHAPADCIVVIYVATGRHSVFYKDFRGEERMVVLSKGEYAAFADHDPGEGSDAEKTGHRSVVGPNGAVFWKWTISLNDLSHSQRTALGLR